MRLQDTARRRLGRSPDLTSYLLMIGVTAVTTGLLFLLRPAIDPSVVALLYLLPVVLSTVLWGLGAGIGSALLAFLTFNFFFIPPYYSLLVHHTQDMLALLVFLGVAVISSQIVGRAKQNAAEASERENEAIRLYELSTVLAGLHEDQAIAAIIARHIRDTFQPNQVEVVVDGETGGDRPSGAGKPIPAKKLFIHLPEQGPARKEDPDLIVPLETGRGLLGEVRVWRRGRRFTPTEERLLRTFASQGVLALERARLSQAETRAQVLEESDRLKSALLSSVSHELRSPLATIKASVSSLHSGEVDWDSEARQDLLATIEEETDHLNQLVSNLLNMSRIESGALKPEREWNVLREILAGVIQRFRSHGSEAEHPFQVQIPEELPLVPVDYAQMDQVFTNLISNSQKYSPIHTPIQIRARQFNENELLVQVVNQGPTVPAEHLDRIFEKFHRVTAADRITGTGLGLSICKGIIEAHGGRIWAENHPEGFTFNFTIPLTWEDAKSRRRPRIPDEGITG